MKFRLIHIILIIFAAGCDSSSLSPNSDGGFVSVGGSTAKFAVSGSYLYVVGDQTLTTFDVSVESDIKFLRTIHLNTQQLETIFPFGDKLFLGSTTGVLIIDISSPDRPVFVSEYQHVVSCDPVVTDGDYAYVTLRSGNNCGQLDDELQIIDLANINNPQVINTYPLTSPRGLALNGNTLYVCDDGVKIFDVSDKYNVMQIGHLTNIPANDVIYFNEQILVTADDGFYQFDVSDVIDINQIGQFNY